MSLTPNRVRSDRAARIPPRQTISRQATISRQITIDDVLAPSDTLAHSNVAKARQKSKGGALPSGVSVSEASVSEVSVSGYPAPTKSLTISERFELFHAANPHIYEKLREFALQMRFARKKKRRKYGIKALFERVRWHYEFEVNSDEEFKLNNDFTALYARKLMEREPDLAGFFETRRRRAA